MSGATKLKGALIGCGFFGQIHLEAWQRMPEVEIVAVCDLNPQCSHRLGLKASYSRRGN